MNNALKVSDLIQTKEKQSKGIEFTHELKGSCGWDRTNDTPQHTQVGKIVYLGYCPKDGDMFAIYTQGSYINIYKGYLNDGTY